MGTGDHARDFRERAVTLTTEDNAFVNNRDTVVGALPFAEQDGPWRRSSSSRYRDRFARGLVGASSLKKAPCGRTKAAHGLQLEPMGDRAGQQFPAQSRVRFGSDKRSPSVSKVLRSEGIQGSELV